MTIASTINRDQFDGDGVTVLFPYTFEINTADGSDIQVFVVDDDDVVTEITSNFVVDVANARISYPTVAGVSPLEPAIAALPVGWRLVLIRIEPLSQTVVLTDQGSISMPAIENGMDKLTMICQQLQEQINRCVKYPVDQAPTSDDVDAFIAAIAAIIQPPIISGTFAYLKSRSAAAPTTVQFGIATDLGTGNALMWYCGDQTLGQEGWFGPLAGA